MSRVIWVLSLVWAASVQAQSVPEDIALAYADGWLKKNPLAVQYQETQGVPIQIGRIERLQLRESELPFYLIHLNPQGYVVMHSDRRLKPVLCFSFSGNEDLQDREDNGFYQLLLTQGQEDARTVLIPVAPRPEWNSRTQFQSIGKTDSSDVDAGKVVGPLLKTAWSQGKCFNEYCPLDPNATALYDGHVPTGCTGTAFAQIMKYHEWPYRGTGSSTYEDTEGSITGIHNASFSDPYEWWHMQDEYDPWGLEPEEAVNAVSELMYELGVAARMDYEHDGSAASPDVLAHELRNHFLYETHTYVSDANQFMDLLINDVNEQRPCCADIPNHAFVIDGHMRQQGDAYFHINYGWGGTNDGWYLLDKVSGTRVVGVITGIRPVLTAIHLDSVRTADGVELRWVLPKTRSKEATRIDVLKRIEVSGTFTDSVEDFNTFKVTSTTDFEDWVLSPGGYSGDCFYKPSGGYTNRQYHLTSTRSFRPGQETYLTFKTKYRLYRDIFSVEISTDNGTSFSSVWSVSDIRKTNWTDTAIPLKTFAGQDILVRFEYIPGRYYTEGGIWIDNIQVVSTEWHEWIAIHQVEELTAHMAQFTTTFQDTAGDFNTFKVTSTTDFKDWILSPAGYSGDCFYKPPGGYSNRQYHLTSTRAFRPGQETYLTFKAKYRLYKDSFSVLISTDNGTRFSSAWSVSNIRKTNWTDISISLRAFAGQDILVRFEYLPGEYYKDGGIWIDEIRLVDITGADYLDYPVYYTSVTDLPEGTNTLAYQVWAGDQIQPRSEAFVVDVPTNR